MHITLVAICVCKSCFVLCSYVHMTLPHCFNPNAYSYIHIWLARGLTGHVWSVQLTYICFFNPWPDASYIWLLMILLSMCDLCWSYCLSVLCICLIWFLLNIYFALVLLAPYICCIHAVSSSTTPTLWICFLSAYVLSNIPFFAKNMLSMCIGPYCLRPLFVFLCDSILGLVWQVNVGCFDDKCL